MTPQERLALALQYQKQRELGSALPSTPAENAARPVQAPKSTWMDALSDIGSGYGYQKAQDLEDLLQAAKHPLDTLHSFTVGVSKAMDNPVATAQSAWQGAKDFASNAVSSPYNLGGAIASATSINPRKIAAALESPAVREIVAYHGTPHRFPATETNPLGEFDASKIGTGEGAQAYGHGIYLAESPDVAKGYQSTLREKNAWEIDGQRVHGVRNRLDAEPINYAANALERFDGDKNAAIAWLKDSESPMDLEAAQLLAKSKTAQKAPGSLYHADLPDEMIDRMLDWDKPLSEQPKNVQNVLQSPEMVSIITKLKKSGQLGDYSEKELAQFKGEDWHDFIKQANVDNNPIVSDFLRQRGIPGIRYRDAGSRSNFQVQNSVKGKPYGEPVSFMTEQQALDYAKKQQAKGFGTSMISGTRNFVVFPGEEKKVKILERK